MVRAMFGLLTGATVVSRSSPHKASSSRATARGAPVKDSSRLPSVSRSTRAPATSTSPIAKGIASRSCPPPVVMSERSAAPAPQREFNCPGGVKIDASGNVWVADIHNNRIEEFNSSGGFLKVMGWGVSDGKAEREVCESGCKVGIAGSGNAQFSEPIAIAISGSSLYVTDSGTHRLQILSTAGAYIGKFGSQGNGGGQFDLPESIATDAAGHLYVADG